jgi:phosphate transport system protein
MPNSDHIVQSYDDDLRHLTNLVLQMGGLVESQVAAATAVVTDRESDVARKIIADDAQIDDLELEVEKQVTKLLALRQPMAVDLRGVLGALRMAADLERMGDLAANIAKRSIALAQTREIESVWMIPSMATLVKSMIKEVLDSYVEDDLEKAQHVWKIDHEVDETYNGLFRQLLTYMMEDPRNITACTHLLFVAKNLERIADHATNMAEIINFRQTGERIPGERPKADDTAMFAGQTANGQDAPNTGSVE